MSEKITWKLRTDNNSVFVDDLSNGKVAIQHNARPGLRPYIHPLRMRGGGASLTEDSPGHHPWQHGIQTGFHGVNGCDFWFDPGQRPEVVTGTIEPSALNIVSAEPPSWNIEAIWRHADGSDLLSEGQSWSLLEDDELLFLDLDWTLQAIPDVEITQHAYGGLFIRMPFRRSSGGDVINAGGLRDQDTEQQAAVWVDLHMPLENSDNGGGITVCDHPENPDHPAHWRVDDSCGINPAPCIPGPIKLPAGATLRLRYRLILHNGPLPSEQIDKLWATYARV